MVPDALELFLASGCDLVVGHGQGQADRDAWGSGADGLDRHAVGSGEASGHGTRERKVPLPGWEHSGVPTHGRGDVRFVQCAGSRHDITQRLGHDATEAPEAFHGKVALPAALGRQPERGREMMEGHHRVHAALAQPDALASVVRQCSPGELALGGLNAAPLHREPVVVEPERRHQVRVLFPAVPRVAAIARRLGAAGARRVLEGPPVVVGVAPLDLVGGRRRAPREARRECLPQSIPSHRRVLPFALGSRVARYRSLTMTSHSSPTTDVPDSERTGTGRLTLSRHLPWWRRTGSSSASAISSPWMGSISASPRASRSAFSDPTGRARRRRCG